MSWGGGRDRVASCEMRDDAGWRICSRPTPTQWAVIVCSCCCECVGREGKAGAMNLGERW